MALNHKYTYFTCDGALELSKTLDDINFHEWTIVAMTERAIGYSTRYTLIVDMAP